MRKVLLLSLIMTLFALAGCRAEEEEPLTIDNINISAELDTDTPAVGVTNMLVTVIRDDGVPVDDAIVTVTGTMMHAGMVPFASFPVTDNAAGVYTVPVEFSMGGDWIFDVTVELASGETTTIDLDIDGVDGEAMDMSDMSGMDMDDDEMSDMGDTDMGTGGVSGAYMTITNNTDEDATLESVSAEGVGMVQIHETVVDENDMASMQELADSLVIPAGETVELMPGGIHIMLMNLENELVEGETIMLTLTFNDGEQTSSFDAPIASMQPENESGSVDNDGIVVSDFWTRPTMLADMQDMDMEDDEMSGMDMEATEESEE